MAALMVRDRRSAICRLRPRPLRAPPRWPAPRGRPRSGPPRRKHRPHRPHRRFGQDPVAVVRVLVGYCQVRADDDLARLERRDLRAGTGRARNASDPCRQILVGRGGQAGRFVRRRVRDRDNGPRTRQQRRCLRDTVRRVGATPWVCTGSRATLLSPCESCTREYPCPHCAAATLSTRRGDARLPPPSLGSQDTDVEVALSP